MRLFRESDAPALARLTVAAIESIGAHGYSPEQVTAWAARHPGPERFIGRAGRGSRICVAVDAGDNPIAYALLEPDGHLDMLYCDPAHSRKGLADRLLKEAEEAAHAMELIRLYTEASELARPAFERAGYAVQNRRDFEIGGVSIHNYAMEKQLR
ncbi:MAG: GNAT family N-acetyltransferase [Erythrobacter sp.]